MKLIAHRGYKTKFIKENTMEAFTNAFNNDFDGIECDVRKTKDNKLVICHDAFLSRVANNNKLISSLNYDELLEYNFGSKNVPSKIPLLIDVLKEYKKIKLIELKTHIDLESILKYIDENTYFISFDSSYMFKLKQMYPNLKFGVLNYIINSKGNYNLDIICLLDSVATKTLVDYFLNRGILVFIYGINKKIKYLDERVYYIVDSLLTKNNNS